MSTRTKLCSVGVIKSLITGRDDYHRGAVVGVRSGDRVVEVTRPLKRALLRRSRMGSAGGTSGQKH